MLPFRRAVLPASVGLREGGGEGLWRGGRAIDDREGRMGKGWIQRGGLLLIHPCDSYASLLITSHIN